MQILNSILNSLDLQVSDVLNSVIILLLVFIFTLIGAYLHEVHQKNNDKNDKIEFNKILVVCITATFVLFFFADKIITIAGYKGLILICFISGGGGHKYVSKFYNGDVLGSIAEKYNINIGDKKEKKEGEDKNE